MKKWTLSVTDTVALLVLIYILVGCLVFWEVFELQRITSELRRRQRRGMDAKEQQLRYGVFDVRTGGPIACVAKAKDIFPHASQISGSPTPAFAGTVDDFLATHHNNPALLRQMKNKVLLDSNPE